MKEKQIYAAPEVEVVKVRIEQNILSANRIKSVTTADADMVEGAWE